MMAWSARRRLPPVTGIDISTWVPLLLGLATVAVLLLLPPGQAILILGAAAAAIVTMVAPVWGLAAMTAVVALNNIGQERLFGADLVPARIVLYGLIAGWLLRTLTLKQPWRLSPVALPMTACLLAPLLSYVVAQNHAAWGREVYIWGSGLIAFVIATQVLRRLRDAWLIIAVLSLCSVATGIAAIIQTVGNIGPASYQVGGLIRAYASFVSPNTFAKYLDMSFPLLTAVAAAWLGAAIPWLRDRMPPLARTTPWWAGLLATVGAFMGAISLALTQSRGGWIGCGLGLIAVALLLGSIYRWAFGAALFVLAMLILLTPLGDRFALRFGSEAIGINFSSQPVEVTPENWAVQERLAHYRAGIHMFEDNPWLGIGAGNFNTRYREYTEVWRFRIPRGHAHNSYIQVAAQTGIIGLVAYLWLIVAVGWHLRTLWRSARGSTRVIVIGVIGVAVAVATHNLFDYLHVGVLPIQLSIVLALAEIARSSSQPTPTAGHGKASV